MEFLSGDLEVAGKVSDWERYHTRSETNLAIGRRARKALLTAIPVREATRPTD